MLRADAAPFCPQIAKLRPDAAPFCPRGVACLIESEVKRRTVSGDTCSTRVPSPAPAHVSAQGLAKEQDAKLPDLPEKGYLPCEFKLTGLQQLEENLVSLLGSGVPVGTLNIAATNKDDEEAVVEEEPQSASDSSELGSPLPPAIELPPGLPMPRQAAECGKAGPNEEHPLQALAFVGVHYDNGSVPAMPPGLRAVFGSRAQTRAPLEPLAVRLGSAPGAKATLEPAGLTAAVTAPCITVAELHARFLQNAAAKAVADATAAGVPALANWSEPENGLLEMEEQEEIGRTTVMLRNIPNKYSQDMLVEQLHSQGFKGDVDFVYLPIDFKNKCNVGYAFLNFRTAEACEKFTNEFHERNSCEKLPGFKSKKVCEVTSARFQGRSENISRLQGSPVMAQLARTPEWLPMLLGPNGEAQPFPVPRKYLQQQQSKPDPVITAPASGRAQS